MFIIAKVPSKTSTTVKKYVIATFSGSKSKIQDAMKFVFKSLISLLKMTLMSH